MKGYFAKMKKKFLALCLVLAMVLVQFVPTDVKAAEYTFAGPEGTDPEIKTMKPGDTLNYPFGKTQVTIQIFYYDEHGSETNGVANAPLLVDGGLSPTVAAYSDNKTPSRNEAFKEWKVEKIYYATNGFLQVILNAVFYTESSIIYNLNKGTNDSGNPDVYYEGKETITLKNATRKGYDFKGWYRDAAFTNSVSSISTSETGNINLYAKFTPKIYNITYVLNGGINEAGNPNSYTYEVGVSGFKAASRDGYTFDGWYRDAAFTTNVTSISGTETGNLKLYAKFTPNTYGITYKLDGGSKGVGNPDSYEYGTGVASFQNARKDGYIFEGWYRDAAFTKRVKSISGTEMGNVTLHAKFTPATYNIEYVLDGGKNAAENPNSYTYEKGVTGFAEAIKDGYTFEGWYSDPEFSEKIDKIPTDKIGPVTLYAKFSGNDYDITYNLNGGKNGEGNPEHYTCGEGVTSFIEAIKDGYTFEGWYSDPEFSEKIEKIPTDKIGPVTLYAKFSGNDYDITYKLDEGKNGAENPEHYTCGEGVASFANAIKAGYDFAGWYSDEEFTTEKKVISKTEFGAVALYAKFTPATYKITYNLDEGKNGAENPTGYTYGKGVTSFADASKTGYDFAGWYSDEAFTEKVTSISDTEMGDIALYAKFTPVTYGITYDLDGGNNGEGNPDSYTYGVGVTSFADAIKERYIFDGWYAEADYKTEVTSISKTGLGIITLYAKFTKLVIPGEGTITVDDVYYGEEISPVVKSATNGTKHVTIEYKQKNDDDNTYTDVKPNAIGDYTARAIFADTEDYFQVVATDDFSIGYMTVPEAPYQINGTKGENDFYISDVTIVPATGFLISDSLTGTFREQMELSTTKEKFSGYLKESDTGAITSAIDVPEIKIDKDAPVISGAQSGETIYSDEAKMEVEDENLSQIFVNGEAVKFENGKATLNLSSNRGEAKYEIVAVDLAGNRSSKQVVVATEWMKSKVIPEGKEVRLYANYSYTLGSGKWKISGDSTTYSGNTTFYVSSEGDYSFSQAD